MPKYSLNIFLPAAGLGERLRPITNHIPKPLLPVLGKPLIEMILQKFSAISSGRIGINLHYKPSMVKKWAMASPYSSRIKFFPENPILGTGGALKNAEAFLLHGNFLVHNTDILSDINLEKLIETHLSSRNIATLATHDYPKYNNVVIDDKGLVIDVENPGASMPDNERIAKKTAYTGIAVYSPEILNFLPPGVSHTTTAWLAATKAGHKVQALDFTGCCWKDIGTPVSYASAIIDAFRADGETVFIHSKSKKYSNIDADGYVAIEKNNKLNKNVSLRNCIVLPKSPIKKNKYYENCILGPDFKIDLDEAEMFGSTNNLILIGTGGSERKYYRAKTNKQTQVKMVCKKNDKDYEYHMALTEFFSKHKIPVPHLISSNSNSMTALFEDLGDTSLYAWLKFKRTDKEIERIYKMILDIAVAIHTKASKQAADCPMLQNRIFDYEYYRWETDYFTERFVQGIKNIKIKNLSALQQEFHAMAVKACEYPKTIIHRDFQSQNIMIHRGLPRIIDYQGARMGLPAYDIASLLWDPYSRLKDKTRNLLLNYYIKQMSSENPDFKSNDFKKSLIICRLQRHMQALGAFGFLYGAAGKKYFLKHIPEGIRLLKKDIALVKKEYPELHNLTISL